MSDYSEYMQHLNAAGVEPPGVDTFGDGMFEPPQQARSRAKNHDNMLVLQELMESEAQFKDPCWGNYFQIYKVEDATDYDFYKKLTAEDFIAGPGAIRAAAARK